LGLSLRIFENFIQPSRKHWLRGKIHESGRFGRINMRLTMAPSHLPLLRLSLLSNIPMQRQLVVPVARLMRAALHVFKKAQHSWTPCMWQYHDSCCVITDYQERSLVVPCFKFLSAASVYSTMLYSLSLGVPFSFFEIIHFFIHALELLNLIRKCLKSFLLT
jgi:hypothetical protein